MFERYTEKARRVIFFARYEAAQVGSPVIETEHLLLGLFREDRALTHHFLPSDTAVESIRQQIAGQTTPRKKISTSVDLPLSHQCKRALAYGAEEAERMKHGHIETSHLLLGLLRENDTMAAQLLTSRGLNLAGAREEVLAGEAWEQRPPAEPSGMTELARKQAADTGERAIETKHLLMAALGILSQPTGEAAAVQKRIRGLVRKMEHAIAEHDFQLARKYSDEEREAREKLRGLTGAAPLENDPSEFIVDEAVVELVKEIFGSVEVLREMLTGGKTAGPTQTAGPTGREKVAAGDLPLTEEAKRALACAEQERIRLKDEIVGPFHVLLGLLGEESSEGAEILRRHGVTLEKTRSILQSAPSNEEGTNYV